MTSLMALRSSALLFSSSVLPALSSRRSGNLLTSFLPAPPPPRRRRSLRLSTSLGFCCKKKDAVDLEAEILEFMDESASPNKFPTREELIAGGRADLAKAVAGEGGWLAYGWQLEEEVEEEDEPRSRNSSLEVDDDCSSSGRSMGDDAGEESGGVEGILRGLEKERSLSYAVALSEKQVNGSGSRRNAERDRRDDVFITNKEAAGSIDRRRSRSISACSNLDEQVYFKCGGVNFQNRSSGDASGMNAAPMWKIWCVQRAGNPAAEFGAGEIVSNEENHVNQSSSDDDVVDASVVAGIVSTISEGSTSSKTDAEEIYEDQIHLRLKRLESELTSGLGLVRSEAAVSLKDQESQLKELHRLCDDLEFKQTEIMNAKDELRSRRAKLAIHQCKMAHKLIEEQKRLDVTKKKLDAAQNALCLLRSTCIIWPLYASEVLLAGSFDGWTSQRKMEKLNSGIFTLHLMLYPGRYEIKFIVDGVWMIDTWRPTVCDSGYENNLLIVP